MIMCIRFLGTNSNKREKFEKKIWRNENREEKKKIKINSNAIRRFLLSRDSIISGNNAVKKLTFRRNVNKHRKSTVNSRPSIYTGET